MAGIKQDDIEEVVKNQDEATEIKPTDAEASEKKLYKLIKNIKYGNVPHKIGEEIEIKDEDLEEFKAMGAIKVKLDEESVYNNRVFFIDANSNRCKISKM